MKGPRSAPLILLTALLVLRGIPTGSAPTGNPPPRPGPRPPSPPTVRAKRKPRFGAAGVTVTAMTAVAAPPVVLAAAVVIAMTVLNADEALETPLTVGMFALMVASITFATVISSGAIVRATWGGARRLGAVVCREVARAISTCAKAVAATAIVTLAASCLALRIQATDKQLKDRCKDDDGMACQWSLTGEELGDIGSFQVAASIMVVALIIPFLTANAFEEILRFGPFMGTAWERVIVPPVFTSALLVIGFNFGFALGSSFMAGLVAFILMVSVRLWREKTT